LKPKFWKRLVGWLVTDPGKKKDFWQRQFLALKVLERIDAGQVDALRAKLFEHPFEELRQWMRERAKQAAQDVTYAKQGGYELVRIPAGEFKMGSPASEEGHYEGESPIHKVRVSRFYMGRYPVTNDEYGRFLDKKPGVKPPDSWADRQFNGLRQPVVGVSWKDANSYASWAGLRLPSEAEWEYACRARTSSRFYLGEAEENLNQAGWSANNSDLQTHPVGEKNPNAWGLYDMHGNVWEWAEDDWHGSYKKAPDDGSAWTDKKRSAFCVIRGGGWSDVPRSCRSAMRYIYGPDTRDRDVGFRLSRSVALGP
jgi:formylglycine-generating enzyme required for sulfatase activity